MSQFTDGVHIAATVATAAAPIVAVFNPAIGAAMGLLTPLAESFLVSADKMVINFRQDMTAEEVIKALNESKSANWPVPPSIVSVKTA